MYEQLVISEYTHRYEDNLVYAKNAGVKRGLMTGMGVGVMWLFIYAAYALAFWYGTGLILDSNGKKGDYDASKLIIVSLCHEEALKIWQDFCVFITI